MRIFKCAAEFSRHDTTDLFVVFVERFLSSTDLVYCLSDADHFIFRVFERHA